MVVVEYEVVELVKWWRWKKLMVVVELKLKEKKIKMKRSGGGELAGVGMARMAIRCGGGPVTR